MNILAEIILLMVYSPISDQIHELGIPYEKLPYPMKPYEERKLPDDLIAKIYNKTDEDLAYEDCMDSYSLCTSVQQAREDYDPQICAINKKTSAKGSFKSMCQLIYENCKNDNAAWGYFHDGQCTVEFVDDPKPLPVETEAPKVDSNDTHVPINETYV